MGRREDGVWRLGAGAPDSGGAAASNGMGHKVAGKGQEPDTRAVPSPDGEEPGAADSVGEPFADLAAEEEYERSGTARLFAFFRYFDVGRALTALATVIVLVAFAILLAPFVIDWSSLKPGLEARASAVLGQKVSVSGDISARFLPVPTLILRDIAMVRVPGAPLQGKMDEARIGFKLWPLLVGKARVARLDLVSPVVVADLADRRALDLDRYVRLPFTVTEGRLTVLAGRGSYDFQALSVDSLSERRRGQVNLSVAGLFEGKPFSWNIGLSAPRGTLRLAPVFGRLNLGRREALVSFSGNDVSGLRVDARLRDMETALEILSEIAPEARKAISPEVVRRFGSLTLRGLVAPTEEGLAVEELEFDLEGLRFTGSARLGLGRRPSLDLALTGGTLNLDGRTEAGALPAVPVQARAGEKKASGFDPEVFTQTVRSLSGLWRLGAGLEGGLTLSLDGLLWRRAVLRNLRLEGQFRGGGLAVERFQVELPGGALLEASGAPQADGRAFRFSGGYSLRTARTRPLLAWALAGRGDFPLGKPGLLALQGRFDLSEEKIAFSKTVLDIDSSRLEGGFTWRFGTAPAMALSLDAAYFDVTPFVDPLAAWLTRSKVLGRLAADQGASLDVSARELILGRMTMKDVALAAAFEKGGFTLQDFRIADMGGRRARATARFPALFGKADDPLAGAVLDFTALPFAEDGSARAPWRAKLWNGVLSVEAGSDPDIQVSGRLNFAEDALHWRELRGRVGETPFTGNLHGQAGKDRPVIRGALALGPLTLAQAGAPDAWRNAPVRPPVARGIDLDLEMKLAALSAWGRNLKEPSFRLGLSKAGLSVRGLKAPLAGGTVSGGFNLAPTYASGAKAQVALALSDADIAALGYKGAPKGVSLTTDLEGEARTLGALVEGLSGTLSLSNGTGTVTGLDARPVAEAWPGLSDLNSLEAALNKASEGDATTFRNLTGRVALARGRADISGLSAASDAGRLVFGGEVDLSQGLVDASAGFTIAPGRDGVLYLRYGGRLGAAEPVVDAASLRRLLIRRLKEADEKEREALPKSLNEMLQEELRRQKEEKTETQARAER